MASIEDAPTPTLWDAMRSIYSWLAIALLTIIFSVLMLAVGAVTCVVQPSRAIVHRLATLWGQATVAVHPSWQLSVTGREHLPAGRPVIFVANHQSLLDILVLFCINHQFKWVAKDTLFRIPFLGWGMWIAGYIPLVRGEFGSIRVTYDRARMWLKRGVSVFFFPEGTRSVSGELQAFKNGAFKLAADTGTTVVPVAITGTRDVLRRGSWMFARAPVIRITILPPIAPQAGQPAEFSRLRDAARSAITGALASR